MGWRIDDNATTTVVGSHAHLLCLTKKKALLLSTLNTHLIVYTTMLLSSDVVALCETLLISLSEYIE